MEKPPISPEEWRTVAEVAEYYPRLFIWLREGQVGGVWNIFGIWCAVLRLIPGPRWILWQLLFRPVADAAPWRVALYASILQRERFAINKPAASSSSEHPAAHNGQPHPPGDKRSAAKTAKFPRPGMGLSAITEEAAVLRTTMRDDLHDRIVTMSSGCIGISGLRGAGKSTLVQGFCAHRYGTPRTSDAIEGKHYLPGMRIMVQAPIKFDAREFLIHQYTCLCRTVQADVRFNPTTLRRQLVALVTPNRIRFGALFGVLSGVIFLAVSALLSYRADTGTWLDPFDGSFGWAIGGAVVAFIAGLAAIGWRTVRAVREIYQVVNLASDAENRLRRLQYQRTDTSSAGGKISAPMGMGVSVGTSHEFTQQLMSLPELIDDYRDFVQRVVGGLERAANLEYERLQRKAAKENRLVQFDAAGQNWSVRLVIGIDQMDQIDDPKAACRFLDELSAVFGIPNCVYLLNVSPATMTALVQRTVPQRTSSAGLFDEVIWVEPLGLTQSTELLNLRVIGLSPALKALCYVLSGGLPRELLRVGRSVVRAVQHLEELACAAVPTGTGYPVDTVLTQAVDAVTREELRALKHRVLASAAANNAGGTLGLLEKMLADDGWPWSTGNPDAGSVIDAIRKSVPSLVASPQLLPLQMPAEGSNEALDAEICNSLMAGSYFLFTVRQLFMHDVKVVRDLSAQPTSEGERDHAGVLSDLARARIALSIGPDLAADLVSAARRALPGKSDADTDQRHLRVPVEIQFLNRR